MDKIAIARFERKMRRELAMSAGGWNVAVGLAIASPMFRIRGPAAVYFFLLFFGGFLVGFIFFLLAIVGSP